MKVRNVLWGLFFIAAGGLIIANQLGYLAGIGLFSLIVTIILIPVIVKSAMHLNFWGILFPFALLGIVYAEPLGITALTPWPILAVALFGSIGLSLIFGKTNYHHCSYHNENFDQVINEPDGDTIELGVKFGSSIKYVNADDFKRGDFGCSFGAMKVYFDNAKLNPAGAEINIDVSFGALELYIPKSWNVANKLSTSFGGVEEKNRNYNAEGSTVILNGRVSFSGVEIIYV